jgi:general stress protein 26
MSELADNVRLYLQEKRLTVFGCTNRDGSAHLTGLWYALRDGEIIRSVGAGARKVRNLKRDPRGSACVIDHEGVRHVTVAGTVTIDEDHVIEV